MDPWWKTWADVVARALAERWTTIRRDGPTDLDAAADPSRASAPAGSDGVDLDRKPGGE